MTGYVLENAVFVLLRANRFSSIPCSVILFKKNINIKTEVDNFFSPPPLNTAQFIAYFHLTLQYKQKQYQNI